MSRPDAVGGVARHFYGLCRWSMAAEAARSGDWSSAETHLRRAAWALGREADLAGCLAELYARAGRTDECLQQTEKAAEADDGNPQSHRRLAQAQWQAGQREQAYLTLTQALRRFGAQSGLYLQMGLFLGAEGRYAEARSAFASAVEADCDSAEAHYYLGLAAAAEGDARAAAKSLQAALDLRPLDLVLAQQLALAARAAARQGVPVSIRLPAPPTAPAADGLSHLADRLAAEPELADALLGLPPGEADGELFGVLAGAVTLALARIPGQASLHLAASRVFSRLDQPEEALRQASQALAIDPRLVQARLQRAELYARAGQTQRAIEELGQAIDGGADWPDVHFRAAELLRLAGQTALAVHHLRRALQLNQAYSPAMEALAALAA